MGRMIRSRTIRHGIAYTAAICLIFLADSSKNVYANFFSRVVMRTPDSAREKAPPSGAAAAMGSEAQVGSVITFEEGILFAHLANNNKIPLVGVGVGSTPPKKLNSILVTAMQQDNQVRLIDTSHSSHNEGMVAQAIIEGAQQLLDNKPPSSSGNSKKKDSQRVEVHVVTKVWYTHLGYERSKISVEESIEAFKPALESDIVDLKLHFLLHWPRCYDAIHWMDCEEEEQALSTRVKEAGPDPRLDPENAWKESWKLLEDLYLSDEFPIASIGVSDFLLADIEKMDSFARIHPHMLQVSLWSLLYDTMLVDYCHKRRIHAQVYNPLHTTIMDANVAPRAYHHIQKVAYELADESGESVSPAQVILAWLIQHGVSVVPATSAKSELRENSGTALANIPGLTDIQVETVAHAAEAYLSQDDFEQDIHVAVTFHAVSKDVMLYWRGHEGEEIRIAHIPKGQTFVETTYPKHLFRTYDAMNKDIYIDHEITANFGEHRDIHVEL